MHVCIHVCVGMSDPLMHLAGCLNNHQALPTSAATAAAVQELLNLPEIIDR